LSVLTQQPYLLIVICILHDWFDKFEFLQFEVHNYSLPSPYPPCTISDWTSRAWDIWQWPIYPLQPGLPVNPRVHKNLLDFNVQLFSAYVTGPIAGLWGLSTACIDYLRRYCRLQCFTA